MSNATANGPQLELAHVLFTDIVAFSKLPMGEQERIIALLQDLVRGCAEYQRAQAAGQLISLPTGDGMALVFFGDPESAVRCAQELATAIRSHPELKLRMGVHSGPVYRVSDINANRNVTGGGINMAQRVMDCGDAGHILISKSTADFLFQVGTWAGALHDLGEAEVKHGVKLHIFNLYRESVGNAARPSKLRVARRKKRTRFGLWIGAAAAVLAVAAIAFWMRAHQMSVKVGLAPVRRSVAVLGFKNLSGKSDQAWLSTALAQMMSTELAAGQKLRTIPGESIAQAKVDFSIPDTDSLTPETLARMRKRLGADLVVLGSYIEIGGNEKNLQIRLDIRLQNADDGEVLVAAAEKGAIDNLFDLVARCGAELRDHLDIGAVSEQQAISVRAALPTDPQAARLYSQGLDRLRIYDAQGARDLLEKAIAIEPKHALTHSALANAWMKLGYDAKAAEEAKRALDLSTDLPREEHLRIEGQYYQALKAWPKAIESYQALFGFYPDNLEYGIDLARVQVQGGKTDDCLKTVTELRKLPAPSRDDPRIDLLEANVAEIKGDSKGAATNNQSAAAKAQALGARLLYAQARNAEGWNQRVLGNAAQAVKLLQEAEQISEQAGDRAAAARAISNLGATYSDQGDRKAARDAFQRSLNIDRDIGYTVGIARALQNLGYLSIAENKAAEGKVQLEQSLATSRSNGDNDAASLTLISLSDVYYQSGDAANARAYAQQAADLAHSIGNQRVEAISYASQAQMAADAGDLATARSMFEKSLAIFREQGAKNLMVSALERLGQVEWSQGDLPAARKHIEEAAGITKISGNAHDVAIAESNLAELSVDEGHFDAAIAALNSVIADFRAQNAPDDLSPPLQYLAEALIAKGQPVDARKALDTVRDKKGDLPNYVVEADYQLAGAYLADPKASIPAVQKLLADKKFTEFESRLEVRLALAKIYIKAGKSADARTELLQVQKDADAKGYALWSKKAAALLKTL